MPTLTKSNIEKLSRSVLAAYLKRLEAPPERIDPIDFSARMCGLHFETADLSKMTNVLGLTSCGDIEISLPLDKGHTQLLVLDGRTAYIDRSLVNTGNRGRLNFTMMHETAHHLLADFFPEEYRGILCRSSQGEKSTEIDQVERQANSLASYLLMPRELVYKKKKKLGINKRLTPEDCMYRSPSCNSFTIMADRLGVSKMALSIRLNQLGIMDRVFSPTAYRNAIDIFVSDEELAKEELWQN